MRGRPALLPKLFTLHPTPDTRHPTHDTRHPTLNTLHSTPYTLHPTPHTPHPTPHTLHPTPYTLHPSAAAVRLTLKTFPKWTSWVCGSHMSNDSHSFHLPLSLPPQVFMSYNPWGAGRITSMLLSPEIQDRLGASLVIFSTNLPIRASKVDRSTNSKLTDRPIHQSELRVTLHSTPNAQTPQPQVSKPQIPNLEPKTPNLKPPTPNPETFTPKPKPQTPKITLQTLKPQTTHAKPQTGGPQTQTPHLKPHTPHRKRGRYDT